MTTHISLTLLTLFMGYHTENNGSSCLNSLWFQNINKGGGGLQLWHYLKSTIPLS